MPESPIPAATPAYLKFASTHMVRGMLAVLRASPQPEVLLKQANTHLARLQEQAVTRVLTEHEFARMLTTPAGA